MVSAATTLVPRPHKPSDAVRVRHHETRPHHCSLWRVSVCACVLVLVCVTALWWTSTIDTRNAHTDSDVGREERCAGVARERRFDCHPQSGASESVCLQRGCCWIPLGEGAPSCFYPAQFRSYELINSTRHARGLTAFYNNTRSSPYPRDARLLSIQVTYISDHTLLIKLKDAERGGWEVPYPQLDVTPRRLRRPLYRVQLDPPSTNLAVFRASDNTTILDMRDVGGLIVSERFLQLSALTDARALYGLGERRGSLRLDTNWTSYPIYSHDQPPVENTNLYGSHPMYVALESSGSSHGVLMFNSDAMEVVLQPGGVTWRVTGGVLTLLVMLGPSPAQVVSQYTALVGRPALPPYWALGFHLCKFNYGSLNETRAVWQRTRDAGIPFDTQWNDLDYMSAGNDFTVSDKYTGLGDFVNHLHSIGMHYVLLIDPGVSASEPRGSYPPYDVGLEMNVFIRNDSDLPFVGKVWNRESTVWPDFTHENSSRYWTTMLANLHHDVPFDGAWIDMNEPSNFVSGELGAGCRGERPPYLPRIAGGALEFRTLCPEARHAAGPHQHMHTLHALTQAQRTHMAMSELRDARPLVLSRASSPGLGAFAAHWSGDVASDWHDLRQSIPEMLSSSLFGISMSGADICGFRGNTTQELCLRWMQLGAFYPFSRNHNSDTSSPQDPVFLGEEVTRASRDSLRLRYTILPYLYTSLWLAHTEGLTVATPLWFLFPEDETTHKLESEFMLGSALLVCPVLWPGKRSAHAYLPPAQPWYLLNQTRRAPFSGWGDLPDDSTVLVKGGSIVVTQPPPAGPVSTREARVRPLRMLVAPCAMRRARGLLYWDDGDVIDWRARSCVVELSHGAGWVRAVPRAWGCVAPPLRTILVMDQSAPAAVTLRNLTVPFSYSEADRLLTVHVDIGFDTLFQVDWR